MVSIKETNRTILLQVHVVLCIYSIAFALVNKQHLMKLKTLHDIATYSGAASVNFIHYNK